MRSRLLLVFIALAIGLDFLYVAVPMCFYHRDSCLGYPVTPPPPSTAPGRYRVLWPAVEAVIAPNIEQYNPAILWVDMLLQFICITITIPCLYAWFRQWVNPDRALIGVMLFGAVNIVSFHLYFRGGAIPFELLFVALSLMLVNRGWLWFIPLVILASLNRETSLVLVAIYAAYHWRRNIPKSLVLFGIWAGITAALRIVLGPAEHQVGGLIGTWEYNTGNISDGIIANLIFIPLLIGVAMNYRQAPAPLRRLVWVALVYIAAIAVGGAWDESARLILPALPLLVPVLLSSPVIHSERASSTSPL